MTKKVKPGLRGTVSLPRRLESIHGENVYAVEVEGDCLWPAICDRDMVIADPDEETLAGDFVVLWPADGGKPACKRLVFSVPNIGPFSPESEVVLVVVAE